jgi:hypothetical protein
LVSNRRRQREKRNKQRSSSLFSHEKISPADALECPLWVISKTCPGWVTSQPTCIRWGTARIVDLPHGLPQGWDLADPKPEALDIDALLRTAKDARPTSLSELLVSASQLSEMEVPAREMVIDPFLPTSSINLLFAQRGVGKT